MSESAASISIRNQRLTSQDASFIYGESFAGPMHVGSLCTFEGAVPFDALVEMLESRIHLIPRYRQRLLFVPWNLNHARWVDDPAFDIRTHVIRHDLPRGATRNDAIKAAIAQYELPLDRRKPLWEMHLFYGLPDSTLVMMATHHCMVDGASGVELMTVLLDLTPEPREVEPPAEPWSPEPPPDLIELMTEAMQDAANAQFEASRRARDLVRTGEMRERSELMQRAMAAFNRMASEPVVVAPWNQGTVTQRRRIATLEYPFADFRRIRGALGGTVNDVVLTALSEGAARYLRDKGYREPTANLRIGCPVNVRSESEQGTLGNRVSMMFATLPATPMDVAERLAVTSEQTTRIKENEEPRGLFLFTELSDAIPPSFMGMMALNTQMSLDLVAAVSSLLPVAPPPQPMAVPGFGINFVATNVPGVQIPMYALGHCMKDWYGLITLSGNLGLGVTIISYNQQIYITLMSEPRLLPDVHRLRDHIDAAFRELLARTGVAPEPVAIEPRTATPNGNGDDLTQRTRDELYEMARQLDIHGRSEMTKEELLRAVRAARVPASAAS